jgi:xeroderma pigmentosum group C-complementing protein
VLSSRPKSHRRGIPTIDDDEDDEYTPNNGDGVNGGGFMPEDAQEVVESGGGFLPEAYDEETGGGFVADDPPADELQGGGFLLEDVGDHDGGFVHEDEGTDDVGGGIVPEDVAEETGAGGFFAEEPEVGHEYDGSKVLDTSDKQPGDAAMLDIIADGNKTTPDSPVVLDDHKPSPDAKTQVPTPEEAMTASTEIATNAGRSVTDDTSARGAQALTSQFSAIEPEITAPLDDTSMNEDVGASSDRDSLISHDPEDDDAEPDWLESD